MRSSTIWIVGIISSVPLAAEAFTPLVVCGRCQTIQTTTTTTSSSTELYGLRSFLRNRFWLDKRKRGDDLRIPTESSFHHVSIVPARLEIEIATPTTQLPNGAIPGINGEDAPKAKGFDAEESRIPIKAVPRNNEMDGETYLKAAQTSVTTITTTTTTTLERKPPTDALVEDIDRPYTMPPIGDRKLTKLEQEFRDMLLDFSQYTKRDIMAVRNPRLRALFEGVAASYSLPECYRAFEILFEDYAPLRIAGRLIYGKLKQVMIEAQEERRKEVEHLAATTGMARHDIEASRAAFLQLVVHRDDRATEMSFQQLVDYGLAETVVEVLGYENFDDFLSNLETHQKDNIAFSELMVGLQNCAVNSPRPECNPALVLQELAKRLESNDEKHEPSDAKTKKINDRYNHMVQKFREWKNLVPTGDGRRLEILRGCFVGAESKEIVEALRIVYNDYSAMRLSGDLIFGIMSALVGAAQRRR